MDAAAAVVRIWRYPVKSMLGEELDSCRVTERGLAGDRAYALVDADGKVASAKNPRKWPTLFECRAETVDGEGSVRIRLPDGESVDARDSNAARVISRALGRDVSLRTEAPASPVLEELWLDGSPDGRDVTDERFAKGSPRGAFFDYAVIHLVTTATLRRLSELYPHGRFDPRRFRPNFLVEAGEGESRFLENGWVGRTLRIGPSVRLEVTDPCARCVMTTLPQDDLPADAGILRTAARHNSPVGGEHRGPQGVYPASIGVYARVLATGTVEIGDPIEVV